MQGTGDLLTLTGTVLAQVRRAKSQRRLSMRAEVARATVSGPPDVLDQLALARHELRTAGRIARLDLVTRHAGDLVVACEF